MKRKRVNGVVAGLLLMGAAVGPVQAEVSQETAGVGVGGVIGALVGGPVGAVLGGALGGHMGWSRDRTTSREGVEERLAVAERALEEKERELQAARDRSVEAEMLRGVRLEVRFRTASSALERHEVSRLKAVARLSIACDGMALRLEGHVDPRGGEAANLKLSQERVAAVRQALIDYGVSPGLISGSAVGEGETLSVHGDAEGYPFDRRVVITFGE